MSQWRPIAEYPTNVTKQGPLVLARDAEKRPMIVTLNEGHFYICPGIPMIYGNRQLGFVTADHVVEFMEIPE